MRRYPLLHTQNTRDLGGYAVDGGLRAKTAYGRVLRSDEIREMTSAEAAFLLELGITTSIDLRSEPEARERPSALRDRPGFAYVSRSLMTKDYPYACDADIAASYFDITEEGEALAFVMKAIADAPGGVLFHCAVGKDRTGVVAALLLLLCGVAEIDVVADYQVTETYIAEISRAYRRTHPGAPEAAFHSKPETMREFLRLFFARHASVEDYLLGIGLAEGQVARLRAKLLS